MILLFVYELILITILLIKSGFGGILAAWPLYLGVLAGSQFALADEWVKRYLPHKLFTQNVLFMPMWLILAIFAFTSITGWFGKGLILGIGWQWFEWKLNSRPWNKTEKLIVLGYAAVFCLASFLI
ncbi:hypothetical protein HZB78_01415 [Candidatus Collierbacteria bacterium]|nr:hypothetical protein [Candidatus Collierbacteria bacterium]